MSESNPATQDYMTQFETALRGNGVREWREIASDLRGHIQEAMDHGKPEGNLLRALGGPRYLARAYAVELLFDAPRERAGKVWRILHMIGVLAAGSLATMVLVILLGSIGLRFAFGGVLLLIVGAIEAAGIHLPHVRMGGLSPLAVMAMGSVMFAVGYAAWAGLWSYGRYLSGSLCKMRPAYPLRRWAPRRSQNQYATQRPSRGRSSKVTRLSK